MCHNLFFIQALNRIGYPFKVGKLKSQVLASWYDKSHKYVIMAVGYSEDVESMSYRDKPLSQISENGYHVFYGYSIGKNVVYKIYDTDGNELEHIQL